MIIAIATNTGDTVGIFNIAGANASEAVLDKTLNLPSATADPEGLARMSGWMVVVVDANDDSLTIVDLSGADTSDLTASKTFTLPSAFGSPFSVAYLGSDAVAVRSNTTIGTFDISGSGGALTATKTLTGAPTAEGLGAISATKLVSANATHIHVIDISAANGGTVTTDKTLTYPSGWSGLSGDKSPNGCTYLGNDKIALCSDAYIAIFDIAAASGAATLDKYFTFPSSWTQQHGGVTFIANPPSVPTSVAGTPGGASGTITWAAPTSDGGLPVTDYEVRAGTGEWISKGASATSHKFDGLTAGTAINLQVRAENPAGYSPVGSANVTPLIDVALSAAATTGFNGGTVAITATFPVAVTGIAAADFSTSAGTLSGFTAVSSTVYRITLTLPATGKGTATVTLAASAGTPANAEKTVDIAYRSVHPDAPINLVYKNSDNAVTLLWENPQGVAVGQSALTDVEVRFVAGSTAGGTWTSLGAVTEMHTIPMLTAGTVYTFQVRIRNTQGYSPVVTVTVTTGTEFSAVAAQILLIDNAFAVNVNVNRLGTKTISEVTVLSEWKGLTHTKTIAANSQTASVSVRGTPKVLFNGVFRVEATFNDNSVSVLDIEFVVVQPLPVFSKQPQIRFYRNTEINLLLPITNYQGGGKVTGPLLGINSEDKDEGLALSAMADQAIAASDNAEFEVLIPNPIPNGQIIRVLQPFYVDAGSPPGMSAVTATGATGEIAFRWAAVEGATSYAYQLDAMAEWEDVGNVVAHTIGDLDPGTTYNVRWRVNSPFISSIQAASATPMAPATAPAQITGFTLSVTAIESMRVAITAPDDGGRPILRYEYSLNGGTWTSAGFSTVFSILNLTKGTSYSVRVRAVNTVGAGPASASKSIRTIGDPGVPTNLDLYLDAQNRVYFSWANSANTGNSPITRYQLYFRSRLTGGDWTTYRTLLITTPSPYDDLGSTGSQIEIQIRIRAGNLGYWSAWSAYHTETLTPS